MKRTLAVWTVIASLVLSLLSGATAYAANTHNTVHRSSVCAPGSAWYTIGANGALWGWGSAGSRKMLPPEIVLNDVTAISGDSWSIMAIRSDASLWIDGATGFDDETERYPYISRERTFEGPIMSQVASADANYRTYAVIKTDGSLWMWGDNHFGLLGISDTSKLSPAPYDVNHLYAFEPMHVMDNVAAVDIGSVIVIALKTDGSVWTWGTSGRRLLGYDTDDGYQMTPREVMDNAVAVSCGAICAAAIKSDGSLWMWGDVPGYGSIYPQKIMEDVASVSCSGGTIAVIKTDGSLWMWGRNNNGAIGNGTYSSSGEVDVPTKIMDHVVDVSSNGTTTIAKQSDGSVWVWGACNYGLLGSRDLTGNYIKWDNSVYQTEPFRVSLFTAPVYSTFQTADPNSDLLASAAVQAAEQEGDEFLAVYELSYGLYYVVLTRDGTPCGVVVKGVKEDGQTVWKVIQTDAVPADEDSLMQLAANERTVSNLSLDYGKLAASATAQAMESYIQDRLNNIDGLSLNDPGKDELSTFIESALSVLASKSISSPDNRLVVSAESIAELPQQIQSAQAEFNTLLTQNNISLNKTLNCLVRLLWQDVDLASPCQITLDEKLAEALDGCSLQILLGNGSHYIQVSADDIKNLSEQHGTINIQISKNGTIYIINFLDQENKIIEKISASIMIALPATGPFNTIMASYSNGNDNWGGQYDANTGTLSFATRYSGQYEVLENNIDIQDIVDLDPDTQEAIKFLVSKGYMSLEDGLFHPELPLTRYEFSKALVGMFFQLDRSLTTSFPDVPAESPYYAYVASGESNNLIAGFPDGTFGGEHYITTEQMLAISARSLVEKKGYFLPENSDYYLAVFGDSNEISEWAKTFLALAVRDGLITSDNSILSPQGDVSREQVALILYRLFLSLYEVPPVTLELPPAAEPAEIADVQEIETDKQTGGTAIMPLAGVSIGGIAAAAGFYILKKKQKI